jgi:hypothetical protein
MRISQVAVLGAAMLLAGGAGGWTLRFFSNRSYVQRTIEETASADLLTDPAHTTEATTRYVDGTELRTDHEADLRCTLHDPEAIAQPASVRAVSYPDGGVELEVGTATGSFLVRWEGSIVPPAGRKCELFGRVATDAQASGGARRLAPAWLEAVGTLARLRASKAGGPEKAGAPP